MGAIPSTRDTAHEGLFGPREEHLRCTIGCVARQRREEPVASRKPMTIVLTGPSDEQQTKVRELLAEHLPKG